MTRPLSFRVRLSPPADRLPARGAALAIVLIVIGAWAVCVGGAWAIAASVHLVAGAL